MNGTHVSPTLAVKPRNTLTPYVLDVYDPTMPETSACVVARYNTRSGFLGRTKDAAVKATMKEIRAALAEAGVKA